MSKSTYFTSRSDFKRVVDSPCGTKVSIFLFSIPKAEKKIQQKRWQKNINLEFFTIIDTGPFPASVNFWIQWEVYLSKIKVPNIDVV